MEGLCSNNPSKKCSCRDVCVNLKVKKVKEKICRECGKPFIPYSSLDKYCSLGCKKKGEAKKEKEKKAKIREKKKVSVSVLTKTLDVVFSRFIRLRDCLETTGNLKQLKCFTCDSLVDFEKSQAMHFIPRGVKKYRFSPDNVFGGCMRCNVLLHGNYLEYFTRMEKRFGRKKIDEMLKGKNELVKFTSEELQEKINHYKEMIKYLESNK